MPLEKNSKWPTMLEIREKRKIRALMRYYKKQTKLKILLTIIDKNNATGSLRTGKNIH